MGDRAPQRPKRTWPAISARHREILRLFDGEGLTAKQIAARLGLSHSRVKTVLRHNGRDSAARTSAARRARARERFRVVWEASPSVAAAARALGIARRSASNRASKLRALGVPPKGF